MAPALVMLYTERMTALLILGVLSMAQAESPLSLEAVPALENGKPVVVARLRNQSKRACVVVLDDFFCRTETQLYDGTGKLLEPRDSRAVRGMRRPPDSVKPVTLEPGGAVEVMTFSIVVDYANAMAGDLSWELQDLAGQTLKVSFTYTFPKEMLGKVEKIGAAGAVVGEWTSPKVEVPTTKLKQQQVNKILASRRRILDAGAIPLLVKALDSNQGEDSREWAAASLGDLKAAVAASALAGVLRKDPSRVVRITAAVALGDIGAPETRGALKEAAEKDSEELVRTRAEEALQKFPR